MLSERRGKQPDCIITIRSSDYDRLHKRGVEFIAEPRSAEYETVVKFRDHFGNLWDLMEPS
jgi:uncharacterized glyoxalase superfamily protein PhnB